MPQTFSLYPKWSTKEIVRGGCTYADMVTRLSKYFFIYLSFLFTNKLMHTKVQLRNVLELVIKYIIYIYINIYTA